MKITIEIDCEYIQDFQSHLLKMFEQSIMYVAKKQQENEDFDPSEEEFGMNDVNSSGVLDEHNCYGTHEVKMEL